MLPAPHASVPVEWPRPVNEMAQLAWEKKRTLGYEDTTQHVGGGGDKAIWVGRKEKKQGVEGRGVEALG